MTHAISGYPEVRQTLRYSTWLRRLTDRKGAAIIVDRIDRLIASGTGDTRSVGGSDQELRVAFGPGYRIYFTMLDGRLLPLLAGGDKSSQSRDIAVAQRMALDAR